MAHAAAGSDTVELAPPMVLLATEPRCGPVRPGGNLAFFSVPRFASSAGGRHCSVAPPAVVRPPPGLSPPPGLVAPGLHGAERSSTAVSVTPTGAKPMVLADPEVASECSTADTETGPSALAAVPSEPRRPRAGSAEDAGKAGAAANRTPAAGAAGAEAIVTGGGAPVLVLEDMLSELPPLGSPELPRLGSPELPTIGSASHHLGACKPCAHAFKGCQGGTGCQFCHLCGPGELKRRKKVSKALERAARIPGWGCPTL